MHLLSLLLAVIAAAPAAKVGHAKHDAESYFLPNETASKVVAVARTEPATSGPIILTQAVAIKETGPKETVRRFGEVYSFSPSFLAVRRDEPTSISFWNLQGDDEHMKVALPPLKKTSFAFTFHREGLFNFYCTMHQPEMSGQILVLPPAAH
jgi:plastocyanin